jgi:WD40 repeat protein
VTSKPHALDVRDLPTGTPPKIGYRDDAATKGIDAYVVVGTDAVVLAGEKVTVEREDGTTLGPYPASSLVRTADASAAAWSSLDGTIMVWGSLAKVPVAIGNSGLDGSIVQALTGDCRPGGQCSAWVSGGRGPEAEAASVRVDQDGTVSPADPSDTVFLVKDVTESGQLVGVSRRDDYNSCSSLVSLSASGSAPWKTCRHTLDAFSPSGAYVAASDSFHSGDLNGSIAIYDTATGKATAYRIANAGDSAYYAYVAWEDDSHILFSAYQDGTWSIVRMGVDGAMEYAVPPADLGDNLARPFVFEGNAAPV